MNKKLLPKKIGSEKFLKLNYANALFMNSREAYRTGYNPQNIFFTFKVVEGDDIGFDGTKTKLLQIHLRTSARDRINDKDEKLDIDIYAFFDEFKEKIIELLNEQENTQLNTWEV